MERALSGEEEDRTRRVDLTGLAERAADIIYRFRLRPTHGFEYVSAVVTQVTGFTPEEHYADPELGFKIVHPDDRALLRAIAAAGPTTEPVVLRWRRKDGTVIWTEQRNTPVYDDAGELVAIEGIARHIADPTRGPGETIRLLGDLRIDLLDRRVYVEGRLVHLTPSEFKLLAFLTSRRGEAVSRDAIMRHLWHSGHGGSGHACEVHISAVRRKIERDPRFPERIVTVRGRGYMFVSG